MEPPSIPEVQEAPSHFEVLQHKVNGQFFSHYYTKVLTSSISSAAGIRAWLQIHGIEFISISKLADATAE